MGAQAQLTDSRRHLETLTQSNAKYQARRPAVPGLEMVGVTLKCKDILCAA